MSVCIFGLKGGYRCKNYLISLEIYISMKEFREVISYFVKVIWQASKRLTIILFLLSLAGGLTLIVELWAMMSLINQLVELDFSQSTFLGTTKTLLPWVLLFIGAMLLKHSIESFRPYHSKLLEERLLLL